MKNVTCVFVLALFFSAFDPVRAAEPEKTSAYYLQVARLLEWTWQPETASIFYSISNYGRDYEVNILCSPVASSPAPHRLYTIQIVNDKKVLYAWNGGPHSVFVTKDDVLFYPVYPRSGSGCSVIAIDLKSGNQLWKKKLRGIGSVVHSSYFNSVAMHLDTGGIRVYGNESMGKYVEILDPTTGDTLVQKKFSVDGKPVSQLLE